MKDKLHIILDLDQTLISSELVNEFNIENEEKMKLFRYSTMDNYYYIFERPRLQEFLTYLFKNFKVSIWTAASKDYALFIIEKIILSKHKNRRIEWIFHSYHCDISQKLKKSIKNLTVLSDVFKIQDFIYDNAFIFDDNDEVYDSQPERCLVSKPFNFTDDGSENDNYLEEVVKQLKSGKSISNMNKRLLR
jgi:TFIIF-interacting CTD phosphatase-like protein